MTFVLVSGKAGAGKSTFGNHLVTVLTRHGLRCRQVELGALLKEITFELLRLFNVPIDSIDDMYNEHKCRYRTYLQQIGTECFRKVFGDDVWCELLMMKLEKMNVMDDVIVITDVRFASERRYFESMGNETITVRVECERPQITMTEAEMSHASETEADGWKYDSRFVNTMDDRIVKDVERWAEKWIVREDMRNENDEMDDVKLRGLEADADEIVRGWSETVNEIDKALKDDGHVDTMMDDVMDITHVDTIDDVTDTHHIDTIPITVMDDVIDTTHVDTANDNSRVDIVEVDMTDPPHDTTPATVTVDVIDPPHDTIEIDTVTITPAIVTVDTTDPPHDTIEVDTVTVDTTDPPHDTIEIDTVHTITDTPHDTANDNIHVDTIPIIDTDPPHIHIVTDTPHDPSPSISLRPSNTITLTSPSTSSSIIVNPSSTASIALGQIGEQHIIDIITTVRPSFDISHVSSTGHLADIHVRDLDHNILYVIEVKLKQVITREDVAKFNRDLSTIKSTSTEHVIGIFASINSQRIPSIGTIRVDMTAIYLTQTYINTSTFDVLFRMVETYYIPLVTTSMLTSKRKEYVIPPKVVELLVRLRTEYDTLTVDVESMTMMQHNTEQTLHNIHGLIGRMQLKRQFIQFIMNEFADVMPAMMTEMSRRVEDDLKEYIRSHRNVRKKDLMREFPSMKTELGSMRLNDIVAHYG